MRNRWHGRLGTTQQEVFLSVDAQRLISAIFKESEPFITARVEKGRSENDFRLFVTANAERVAVPGDQGQIPITIDFDPEREVLSFSIARKLPKDSVRMTVEKIANRLNLRKNMISRVAISGDKGLSLVTIFAVNVAYIDPEKVTGFEAPMRYDIEYFFGEATINLMSLLTLLP